MRPIYDYLRVALACFGYVLIEPVASKLLAWIPDPYGDIIAALGAVLVAALLSWLIFQFLDVATRIEIGWQDRADGVSVTGPVLDVRAHPGQMGQIFRVKAMRETRTWLGRKLFAWLVRHEFMITIEPNQDELALELASITNRVAAQENRIWFIFGKAEFGTNSILADVGLTWDGNASQEFSARLRYSVGADSWGSRWVAKRLVRIAPTVREVRKLGA